MKFAWLSRSDAAQEADDGGRIAAARNATQHGLSGWKKRKADTLELRAAQYKLAPAAAASLRGGRAIVQLLGCPAGRLLNWSAQNNEAHAIRAAAQLAWSRWPGVWRRPPRALSSQPDYSANSPLNSSASDGGGGGGARL